MYKDNDDETLANLQAYYITNLTLKRKLDGVEDLPKHEQENLEDYNRVLDALEVVIREYMTKDTFEAWLDSVYDDADDEPGDANVTVSITEHKDGSATFSFDMPPEVMRSFAAVGLRVALEKAVAKVETMV